MRGVAAGGGWSRGSPVASLPQSFFSHVSPPRGASWTPSTGAAWTGTRGQEVAGPNLLIPGFSGPLPRYSWKSLILGVGRAAVMNATSRTSPPQLVRYSAVFRPPALSTGLGVAGFSENPLDFILLAGGPDGREFRPLDRGEAEGRTEPAELVDALL